MDGRRFLEGKRPSFCICLQKGAREAVYDVTIIGAAIIDVLAAPVNENVFSIGSQPMDTIEMSFGGDALNEAVILSRLGKRVQLITKVGDDEAGRRVLSFLEENHISSEGTVIQRGLRTGINIVLIDEKGNRHFLTNPSGSLRRLSFEDIEGYLDDAAGIVSFAGMFVSPLLTIPEMKRLFSRIKDKKDRILAVDMTKAKNGEVLEDIQELLPYIDYIFPAYGIRFIALSDNVDTADRCSSGMDMMPIMNVFNEWHAANTSKKIRAVLECNWRKGKYTNWAYPYGYKAGQDEKRTAVIDEKAAAVVHRIFDLRLQGNSARDRKDADGRGDPQPHGALYPPGRAKVRTPQSRALVPQNDRRYSQGRNVHRDADAAPHRALFLQKPRGLRCPRRRKIYRNGGASAHHPLHRLATRSGNKQPHFSGTYGQIGDAPSSFLPSRLRGLRKKNEI